jgi:hypothetical protein
MITTRPFRRAAVKKQYRLENHGTLGKFGISFDFDFDFDCDLDLDYAYALVKKQKLRWDGRARRDTRRGRAGKDRGKRGGSKMTGSRGRRDEI